MELDYLFEEDFRKKIKEKDIIICDESTYPKELFNLYSNFESNEDLILFLKQNNYSLIAHHCTRLTDFEIDDIKKNGLTPESKELLLKKIDNLPQSIDCSIKKELKNYVSSNKFKCRNQHEIYFSCGYLNFQEDEAFDKIFTQLWGGEDIYSYYDNGNTKTSRQLEIERKLCEVSYPCIVVARINFINIKHIYNDIYSLIDSSKQNGFKKLSVNILVHKKVDDIIKVIKLK